MENTSSYFTGNRCDFVLLEDHQSNFDLQVMNYSGPDDKDENENEDEGEDSNEVSGDDNPPLDDNVVHSPVLPQTGGKPQ
jgi:hypothetical protein